MAIYVSGVVCRDVLEEKDGTLSLLRLSDVVTIDIPEDIDPSQAHMEPVNVILYLSFRSDGPEDFVATIRALRPDGQWTISTALQTVIEGVMEGHHYVLRLEIDATLAGVWTFEIKVRDELVLKVRFLVNHKRVSALQPALNPPPPTSTAHPESE